MRILAIFIFLSMNAHAASDVRAFWWSEARSETNGEKLLAFYVAPAAVMKFYEAIAAGSEAEAVRIAESLPKSAWSYVIALSGDSDSFGKDKVLLREGTICGDFPTLESGTVSVDRKNRTVRISLKVRRDGMLVNFEGNGEFKVTQAPNKAPEPTPGAVTPRATEGAPR